ncbi:MAG: hypothetical protein NVSMB14_09610 [Isosphaeraceae bacterium]
MSELTFTERSKSIAVVLDDLRALIEQDVEQSPTKRETLESWLEAMDRLRLQLRSGFEPSPSRPRKTLEALLLEVTETNIHREWDSGPSVGEEA